MTVAVNESPIVDGDGDGESDDVFDAVDDGGVMHGDEVIVGQRIGH